MQKSRLVRSALMALPISGLLCAWGSQNSMAMAHTGSPLALLFLPVLPLFFMPGVDVLPNWLFDAFAFALEYGAITWLLYKALRLIDRRKEV